ncbi:MAG: WbqC family protein [Anaerolineae bacterium]
MKKIAIIQSNYIPWKGYFDIIHEVDVFVFLDDVQMTKRDWRTRNKIKTPKGTEWLTVPVKGGRHQLICETEIAPGDWQKRHLKSLQTNYARTPFFKDYGFLLDWLYGETHRNLSEFNRQTTGMICDILGIDTQLLCSMDLRVDGAKDDRLIEICQKLGATVYLSGPSARDYIVEEKFQEAGIEVVYKDYAGYPEYPQSFPPFEHAVSILDLLFNCGPAAPDYIWGWREGVQHRQEDSILTEVVHEAEQVV